MPEILPPKEHVDSCALSAHEIREQYIAYEGLGYCIYHYIPTAKIADNQLAALWMAARTAMQDVVDYLEEAPEPIERKHRTIHRTAGGQRYD